MRTRHATTLLPMLALAVGLTASCGGGSDEGSGQDSDQEQLSPGQPAPPATSPPPATPPTAPPTAPPLGKDRVDPVTVTGTVRQGVEAGCLTLQGGGQVFLLLGEVPPDLVDREVRVTGTEQGDVLSTCQEGTPLQVASVEPG